MKMPTIANAVALLSAGLLWFPAARPAFGAVVFSQPPASPPAGGVPSQWWFDPTGQNNLDSDAEAYDNFLLAQATSISSIEWWGDAGPSVGFFVGFYNQDPNTVGFQPDLPQIHGHPPLTYQTVTKVSQTLVANGQYHFSATLPQPVSLAAGTRYFVSVADSMPTAFATWGWSAGTGGDGRCFYYQLAGSPAGGPYYTIFQSDRAFSLSDDTPTPPQLRITYNRVDHTAGISWPTNAVGFALQSSPALGTVAWQNVSEIPVISGDQNVLTVPAAGIARWYRLVHP